MLEFKRSGLSGRYGSGEVPGDMGEFTDEIPHHRQSQVPAESRNLAGTGGVPGGEHRRVERRAHRPGPGGPPRGRRKQWPESQEYSSTLVIFGRAWTGVGAECVSSSIQSKVISPHCI